MQDFAIELLALIDERFVRVITIHTDVVLPLSLRMNATSQIEIVMGDVKQAFTNVKVTDHGMLSDDPADIEAALAGMREGETRQFPVTFPSDYHGKEVAGKLANFVLTVKSVSASHLPAVDADFAKAFGIASGSVEDLKSEIATNLELELKRKIEGKLKEQAFAALRQKADFALPKSLVEQEAQSMARRMAADLQQQGMKPDDIKQLSPDMFRAGAESRVALGLVLAEVVNAHGLKPKPEQVKALVHEAAQTYEQPEAVVRWHYDKPERLNEFETLAVERNVVDWLLQRVKVEDRHVPFRELMEPARS
jgi:trigger factor